MTMTYRMLQERAEAMQKLRAAGVLQPEPKPRRNDVVSLAEKLAEVGTGSGETATVVAANPARRRPRSKTAK